MTDYSYPPISRLLHRIALGNRWVAEASFDLEQALLRPEPLSAGKHVFVCGLARAGTTILMRLLYETTAFSTLTYRHMPFVLMPGLWRRLSAHQQQAASPRERAHGDRIIVGYDSPEAFEEVFWTTHCPHDYIFPDYLAEHRPASYQVSNFKRFLGSVIAGSNDPGRRYLSKNNNNLLRLPTLQKHLPDAFFLVPFRDPLQHGNSLLEQHRRFSAIQRENPFVRDYMRWLGHFEFGLDHRAFFHPVKIDCGPDRLDYWLQLWIQVHERILQIEGTHMLFVSYEDLCSRPEESIHRLWTCIDLDANAPHIELRAPPSVKISASRALMQKTEEIFLELKRRSLLNA